MDVDAEMARVQLQIEKVENDILKVEKDIQQADNALQSGGLTPEEKNYRREQKQTLQRKKEALRAKEQVLREKENKCLDLKLKNGFDLARAVRRVNNIRQNYLENPEFLWDPDSALHLPYPYFGKEEDEGIYVGREAAKAFYDAVTNLSTGQRMLVIGAKGSGKSTVAKAIVGTLIVSGKPALYMTASQIREKNWSALLHGLLLAFPENQTFVSEPSWEDLIYWAVSQTGPILLFIDDWDSPDDYMKKFDKYFESHIRVKVSSTNSNERRAFLDTDKPKEKYGKLHRFDGPYTKQELNTWICNSGLLEKFQANINDLYLRLEKWTGGMPRLLATFAEVQGDEIQMADKLDFYVGRLKSFIDAAKTRKDLLERFLMVTRGAKFIDEFDSACFYQDESFKWHILCPYLQRKGASMILDREDGLSERLTLDEIGMWARAVEWDCISKRNPAHLGWNVEGLVIGVIKYMRMIFTNKFGKCIEYSRGQEASTLRQQSERCLQEGILMVPMSFNEEALDVFYIIMLPDGTYSLIALQISVAKWKAKLAKGSHQIWKEEILKRIEPAVRDAKYSQRFIYVMPTAAGQHGDKSEKDFTIEPFRRIHDCLKWIDDGFELEELARVQPPLLKPCNGKTRAGQPCRVQGRSQSGQTDFFCRHHKPSSN